MRITRDIRSHHFKKCKISLKPYFTKCKASNVDASKIHFKIYYPKLYPYICMYSEQHVDTGFTSYFLQGRWPEKILNPKLTFKHCSACQRWLLDLSPFLDRRFFLETENPGAVSWSRIGPLPCKWSWQPAGVDSESVAPPLPGYNVLCTSSWSLDRDGFGQIRTYEKLPTMQSVRDLLKVCDRSLSKSPLL